MPYLVQRGNVALSAVILGQCAGCASSLRTFCGREAGMPVLHFLTIPYEDESRPIMPADTQSEYPITA
jgi:hypothetical protein